MGTISLRLCCVIILVSVEFNGLAWKILHSFSTEISIVHLFLLHSSLLAMMPQATVLSQQRNASKRAFPDLLLSFPSSMLAFDGIGIEGEEEIELLNTRNNRHYMILHTEHKKVS